MKKIFKTGIILILIIVLIYGAVSFYLSAPLLGLKKLIEAPGLEFGAEFTVSENGKGSISGSAEGKYSGSRAELSISLPDAEPAAVCYIDGESVLWDLRPLLDSVLAKKELNQKNIDALLDKLGAGQLVVSQEQLSFLLGLLEEKLPESYFPDRSPAGFITAFQNAAAAGFSRCGRPEGTELKGFRFYKVKSLPGIYLGVEGFPKEQGRIFLRVSDSQLQADFIISYSCLEGGLSIPIPQATLSDKNFKLVELFIDLIA